MVLLNFNYCWRALENYRECLLIYYSCAANMSYQYSPADINKIKNISNRLFSEPHTKVCSLTGCVSIHGNMVV